MAITEAGQRLLQMMDERIAEIDSDLATFDVLRAEKKTLTKARTVMLGAVGKPAKATACVSAHGSFARHEFGDSPTCRKCGRSR